MTAPGLGSLDDGRAFVVSHVALRILVEDGTSIIIRADYEDVISQMAEIYGEGTGVLDSEKLHTMFCALFGKTTRLLMENGKLKREL